MTFHIGNTIWHINSLRTATIDKIEFNDIGKILSLTVTFEDNGEALEANEKCFTQDYKHIIECLREQVQEYKDAFFRQKTINQKQLQGRVFS